jgi:hypothetical protein
MSIHQCPKCYREIRLIPECSFCGHREPARKIAMTSDRTLQMARFLADKAGEDQSIDDVVHALCGMGPLLNCSGNQLAGLLLRHILKLEGADHG